MKRLPTLVSYPVFAALSLCAWIASPYAAETAPKSHPTVHTDKGDVRGLASADHREFLGIPFAAPPVGNLRFAPPQPHRPWNDPLDATKSKSSCPQLASAFGAMPSDKEDCLYLNIYAPAKVDGPLPVFFWIHGGGFFDGGGSSPVYSGVNVVKKGKVIVVSTNYRLNAFGFLAASALSNRSQSRFRKLRTPGSAGRAAMGAEQYRELRRRSAQGHDRRRVGWRSFSFGSSAFIREQGTVPGSDRREHDRNRPGAVQAAYAHRGGVERRSVRRAGGMRKPGRSGQVPEIFAGPGAARKDRDSRAGRAAMGSGARRRGADAAAGGRVCLGPVQPGSDHQRHQQNRGAVLSGARDSRSAA